MRPMVPARLDPNGNLETVAKIVIHTDPKTRLSTVSYEAIQTHEKTMICENW